METNASTLFLLAEITTAVFTTLIDTQEPSACREISSKFDIFKELARRNVFKVGDNRGIATRVVNRDSAW